MPTPEASGAAPGAERRVAHPRPEGDEALVVRLVVTLADIKREIEEQLESGSEPAMCFYGANSCWWTHDFSDVFRTPSATPGELRRIAETLRYASGRAAAPLDEFMERAREVSAVGLPCDPRGMVLYETRKADALGFLASAIDAPSFYGRHGLDAFVAAHARNSFLVTTREEVPWCATDWEQYNVALDRAIERGDWPLGREAWA